MSGEPGNSRRGQIARSKRKSFKNPLLGLTRVCLYARNGLRNMEMKSVIVICGHMSSLVKIEQQ
jgi:hypothetical protein